MEQPTEPGFYWMNDPNGEGEWEVVQVKWARFIGHDGPTLAVFVTGYDLPSQFAELPGAMWGPRIEPPCAMCALDTWCGGHAPR